MIFTMVDILFIIIATIIFYLLSLLLLWIIISIITMPPLIVRTLIFSLELWSIIGRMYSTN